MLPRALGHDDDRMPPRLQALPENVQETSRAFQFERHLGNQDEVGIAHGERGVTSNEARVTTHQFDQTNPVGRGLRFGVGRADGAHGLGNGGLKAEALVDEHDVVVDRLRDADHGDLIPAFGNDAGDSLRAPQGAVASNDEEDVDAHPLQTVDDLFRDPVRRARCRGSFLRAR